MKTTVANNTNIEIYEDNGCGLRAYIVSDGKPITVDEFGEMNLATDCAEFYEAFIAGRYDVTLAEDDRDWAGLTREDVTEFYRDDLKNSVLIATASYDSNDDLLNGLWAKPAGQNGREFVEALGVDPEELDEA